MRVMLLVAALLATPTLADEGLHPSVSLGAGGAQAGLGLGLQARYRHLALFASVGAAPSVDDQADPWMPGFAAGARFYFRDAGDGPFLSGQAVFFRKTPDAFHVWAPEHLQAYTATLGWRFQFEPLFIDVAAGAGLGRTLEEHGTWLAVDLLLAIGVTF